ncbi:transglutaminase family protein [Curvibacter sp. APW13]|uniref:transglutaminase family protein n=1 Tax=Curvibacter sp. APW13 TaxID=3077236 RepID=UPI0028DF4F88|nr:transglutaminase family protein [Curvibacter sp. APW13]MDT8991501.1 transglutaminase family protein [Curvibacter sp. APW13]
MLLSIRHETLYRYAAPVSYSLQTMRLWPRADSGQRVRHWRIEAPGRRWMQTDAFGNTAMVSSLTEPHQEIKVVAVGEVDTVDEPGALMAHDTSVPPLAFALPTSFTEANAAIAELARTGLQGVDSRALDSGEAFMPLMARIAERIEYTQGVTSVGDSAIHAIEKGKGVCQDMTHVLLACCRSVGLPARYVSGYLRTDASHAASHAWAEVWLAGAHVGRGAWVGLDVTHQRLAGPELCRLAVGRDYNDASPVRGIHMGGSGEQLSVHVNVQEGGAGADQ